MNLEEMAHDVPESVDVNVAYLANGMEAVLLWTSANTTTVFPLLVSPGVSGAYYATKLDALKAARAEVARHAMEALEELTIEIAEEAMRVLDQRKGKSHG